MAVPAAGVKLDDGKGGFFTNCFPARNGFRQSEDAGAWLVAQKAEQRRHFKAVLCAKPKTYAQIKHERKEKEKEERRKKNPPSTPDSFRADNSTSGMLDGFFLMKHCCVDDPTDVCSINITDKELTDVKEEDFQLFDNVAYINAGENLLPFEAFTNFPIVRELEIPLNALRGIRVEFDDFPCLEVLDLSYNNLSKDDILALGILPKLKVLFLTGNQLRSLPAELAKPIKAPLLDSQESSVARFPSLELLSLDDNHLTDLATFASLAGLKRLKRLNLDKNEIHSVPHLRALSGKHIAVESESPSRTSTPGRKSRRKESKSRSSSRSGIASPGVTPVQPDGSDTPDALQQYLTEIKEESGEGSLLDDTLSHDLPPPFPELEHLSLAFNKIEDEESLLAVAAWPMLKELIIHDNPLTTNSSGDPPLLKRYLQDRLGITMIRKKPDKKPKPVIQVPTKPHRKVAEVVPPIPKKPLQLMLESAPAARAALPPSTMLPTPPRTIGTSQHPVTHEPLPPIPGTPVDRPKTDPLHNRRRHEEGTEEEKMSRTKSWTQENFEERPTPPGGLNEAAQQADEPVFLTQVDDQTEEPLDANQVPPSSNDAAAKQKQTKKEPRKKERVDSAAYSISVPNKFKGYEIFYDTPDDPDFEPVVKDIQGNLRSLRLALKQSTLYQNQVDLERPQKPFEPYQRSTLQPRPPHKNKAEKLEDILETMKKRLVIDEINLGKILEDKTKLKKEYPKVVKLLQEIQTKYSTVRATSMHDKESQQEAVSETLLAMQSMSDRLKEQKSAQGGARSKSSRTTTRVKSASLMKS